MNTLQIFTRKSSLEKLMNGSNTGIYVYASPQGSRVNASAKLVIEDEAITQSKSSMRSSLSWALNRLEKYVREECAKKKQATHPDLMAINMHKAMFDIRE